MCIRTFKHILQTNPAVHISRSEHLRCTSQHQNTKVGDVSTMVMMTAAQQVGLQTQIADRLVDGRPRSSGLSWVSFTFVTARCRGDSPGLGHFSRSRGPLRGIVAACRLGLAIFDLCQPFVQGTTYLPSLLKCFFGVCVEISCLLQLLLLQFDPSPYVFYHSRHKINKCMICMANWVHAFDLSITTNILLKYWYQYS